MATSKTLTPTNVTISIPEFTDQPDQRVNSNCIDKEADAINKINTEATNTNIGSFATLAGLATLLDTMLGNMQSAGVKSFQTNATATVDPFTSGLTYMGTIFKSGTNTTFTYVEMRPISENKKIIGRRQSGGGYTWQELATESNLIKYSDVSNIRLALGGGSSAITATAHDIVSLTVNATRKGILFFAAEGVANLTANEVMVFRLYDGTTTINNYGQTNMQGNQWISTAGQALISSTGSRTFKLTLTTYGGSTNITIPAYCQMAGTLMFMPLA